MKKKPLVITDNNTLRAQYQELAGGDIVIGRIRLKPTEEHLLLDLVERGVQLFPSAISQLACRSKALQARLFSSLMLPHTRVAHDQHDLMEVMLDYKKSGIKRVVTKLDRRNAGLGVYLWPSIEDVYTQASLNVLPYPIVLQPFIPDSADIRVIVLGDYVEAYSRHNPNNFRNNLRFGGESKPCTLTESQWSLCREAMGRGKFPYAHIDLMVTGKGEQTYFAEINLRGGIKGAAIRSTAYQEKIDSLHRQALQEFHRNPA